MKHFSVKFKADRHLVKATVVAKNIIQACRMMEAMYPEIQDCTERSASFRVLWSR